MIKSSKHFINFCNSRKKDDLKSFIFEYRRCLQWFVDYIWKNGYTFKDKDGNEFEFSVKENKLQLPSMISSDIIKLSKIETNLTGRALKCCMTQCAGIINASVEKQRKRLYIFQKKKKEGISKRKLKSLILKIKQNIPKKPNCLKSNLELNSICCDYRQTDKEFNGFLQLKSITKEKLKIKIPVKFSRHSLKLSKGKLLNSFLINEEFINFRWEFDDIKEKEIGNVVGCDQGLKDILTCSDGTVTQKSDKHGHTLETIINKVIKKRKGSNAFKKAKEHQKNFVNWSINQLNLNHVKQINLEEIWNINYKKKTNKKLYHWQNTLIRDKIESKCKEDGIRLIYQSSTYRSQRCSCCGNVRKSNRKGKIYDCKNCGNTIDADLNAAKNHEINLPEIPYALRKLNLNRKDGFIWNQNGYFDLAGRSLQSLLHVQK
jgi:putative transposase